jgi:hypothetical protein
VEVRNYVFPDPEPDPIPRLQAELDAEVGRLIAGKHGESELEQIYLTRPGPVTRRWSIIDLSVKRIARSLHPHMKGCLELTAICTTFEVMLELVWAEKQDDLKFGAVAQKKIVLPIINSERPPLDPPTGIPEGGLKTTLELKTRVETAPKPPEKPAPEGWGKSGKAEALQKNAEKAKRRP